jgi:hypothetical protein
MRHPSLRPARSLCVALALALGIATTASAHDTWLLPVTFDLPGPARVEVDLTSGMRFPELESAVVRESTTPEVDWKSLFTTLTFAVKPRE